jgi:hypothetical protein
MSDRDCPKCGERRVVREGMFHWRGTTFSGLYCKPCNGVWDNPVDSFMAAVAATATPPVPSSEEPK